MTVSLVGPLLAFAAVLVLIPAALWLLKRSRLVGVGAAGALRLVATLPLAPSQRIVTVEVGSGEDRRWLVVGVTPSAIQLLHSLPPQAEAPAVPASAMAAALPAPFAQLLSRQRGSSQNAR